jgi:hypothetical protein
MLALGVRFDDRVTGKLEAFATRSRIVHIDIDPAEIHKNKHAHIPICAGGWVMQGCFGTQGHGRAWRSQGGQTRSFLNSNHRQVPGISA